MSNRRYDSGGGTQFGDSNISLDAMDDALFKELAETSPENAKAAATEIVAKGGEIQLSGFKITSVGLVQTAEELTEEDWWSDGNLLLFIQDLLPILIGDWLQISDRFGYGDIKALAEKIGRAPKTISNWKYVMGNIEMSLRREPFTFGHYQVVAGMKKSQQTKWLQNAFDEQWSPTQLRDAIQGKKLQSGTVPDWQKRLTSVFDPKRIGKMSTTEREQAAAELERLAAELRQWGS